MTPYTGRPRCGECKFAATTKSGVTTVPIKPHWQRCAWPAHWEVGRYDNGGIYLYTGWLSVFIGC